VPASKPQPPKSTSVAQTLDDFADESKPPAKSAAKPNLTDDLDDEIPF
jgi:hypothetical protein